MNLQKLKSGFTLIELLVVITIIGILATGWVSVFTTQLQGARDSTRVNDMKLLETSIHQYFNDVWVYPAESGFTWTVDDYVSKDLVDPKTGNSICWIDSSNNTADCAWYYHVGADAYNLPNSAFKLWIAFEKKVNYETKADNTSDGWTVAYLLETFAWSGSSVFDIWEAWSEWVAVY